MRQTGRPIVELERSMPIEGLDAPVEVRRHPAARRMTLRVSRTRRTVIVTLPVKCCMDAAGTFVSRHIDWVRERLDTLPPHVPLADGSLMPLRGEPYQLSFLGRRQRGLVVAVEPPQPSVDVGGMVEGAGRLVVAGDAGSASRRLTDWLIAEARRDLEACVAVHARRLGVRPKRIAVRDQASRWGSCSTTGVLSFSWRLVLAPPFILDYVAAHEVAHLREMNHGPRFWALVEQTYPEMRAAKRWLRSFGMELHRYG